MNPRCSACPSTIWVQNKRQKKKPRNRAQQIRRFDFIQILYRPVSILVKSYKKRQSL